MRLDEPGCRGCSPLLDGRRTIGELLSEATTLVGPAGPGRLARLIAECGDRGHARRDRGDAGGAEPSRARWRARSSPASGRSAGCRTGSCAPTGTWGRSVVLPARGHRAGPAVAGRARDVLLSDRRPLRDAAGRGAPSAPRRCWCSSPGASCSWRSTSCAHGLALAHYGRRTDRAGLRLLLIFPYAFVDTSEAYFEPPAAPDRDQRRRAAIRLRVGAAFAIACAVSPRGNVRDVLFQLAFAAYVGAFFNANPFLDRDGYQILSDWLGEPRAARAGAGPALGAAVGHDDRRRRARSVLGALRGRRSGLVADRRRLRARALAALLRPADRSGPARPGGGGLRRVLRPAAAAGGVRARRCRCCAAPGSARGR